MVILSGREAEKIADQLEEASHALEDSARLNQSLLADFFASQAKVREYANMIVTQAGACQQIMQINLCMADAIARIRSGEEVEAVASDLDAVLSEFGGPEA
jgi:hypothetical protein